MDTGREGPWIRTGTDSDSSRREYNARARACIRFVTSKRPDCSWELGSGPKLTCGIHSRRPVSYRDARDAHDIFTFGRVRAESRGRQALPLAGLPTGCASVAAPGRKRHTLCRRATVEPGKDRPLGG